MTRILYPLLPFALAILVPVVAAFAPDPEPIPPGVDQGFLSALKEQQAASVATGAAFS